MAEHDRGSAEFIACRVNAARRQDKHTQRTVDDLLRVANTVDEILFLVDDGGDELCGIHFAVLHLKEMRAAPDDVLYDLIGVIDLADGRNGEGAVMRTHQNRLCFIIGDAADAERAVHRLRFRCKLRAERSVFNVVNGLVKAGLRAVNRHARAACAEVGVVINAEKKVENAVSLRCCAEKTAHKIDLPLLKN